MIKVVSESTSFYDVFRKLNIKPTGSANGRIRHIVKYLNISTSHFLGRASNRGPNKKGGPKKLTHVEVLVLDRLNGRKEEAWLLRQSLIEIGIKYECEKCRLNPEWNGEPLTFQIDHRNGNCLDNRFENLRFLCPNCHSQTPNFGSKNINKKMNESKLWSKGRTRKKRIWENGKRVYAQMA
jgi:hypothetical protein